uniref:Phosphorylated adapter RNA export protein n=2 Tax=Solanum tuberosum TaxID=4113 RepID=M1D682_SOLTU
MVDAIQTCGGQKTADSRRFRTGGGILWSILKVRDPNAYKEIMKKGKEFEKQFKQANLKQEQLQNKEASFFGENGRRDYSQFFRCFAVARTC